jgi:hypothetical protein
MDAAASAAVGVIDDVFSAEEFGKRDDTIGEQFRVLDESMPWLTTPGAGSMGRS